MRRGKVMAALCLALAECGRDAMDPGIEDMAATALALFGIDRPAWMEGKPLL